MTVAILVLAVSWALPLGLAVALAFRGHLMWAAALVTVFAIPHQLMGLTSTCTQGADGTFGTGAIFSGPLLLIAVGVTWWALNRRKVDPSASWVTLAVPLILLVLTQGAWVNTLQHGTPCGEDFAWYGGSSPAMVMLILVGYLVLPLCLAISAAGSLMMARRLSAVTSN
ncbi:hypothetical protein VW35_00245 [Devosia soli]|uniref:Uncharacterized protein n=1 Tax=Devosia soli TaxID=361041 RepID=A0A0F5LJJ6_9HYPH|nr:hypothetical protein [Devosia soli]KKB82556.1 hypothetical protein VW35_00245 [Devosia soli]